MAATSCVHDSACPQRTQWCETLDALTRNEKTSLKLKIDCSMCNDEMAKGLGNTLKITTSLTELIIYSSMTHIGAQAIANGLQANSTLQSLWIIKSPLALAHNTHISSTGIRALTDVLQAHPSLTRFTLINNSLGVDEAKQFSAVLRTNTILKSLDLSNNDLKDCGAQEILDGLKDNVSLTQLNLYLNNITSESAPAIATVIRKTSQLTHFNITENPIHELESLNLIKDALYQNSSIIRPFIIPSSYSSPWFKQKKTELVSLAERNSDNAIAHSVSLFHLLLPILLPPETAKSSEPTPILEEVSEPPALALEEALAAPAQPEPSFIDFVNECTFA